MNFKPGSKLVMPDGSVYIYAKCAEDLSKDDLVVATVTGSIRKREEGVLPQGIIVEDCKVNDWTWVCVQQPNALSEQPKIVTNK